MPSAIHVVPHSQELPIPTPPEAAEIKENASSDEDLEKTN